MLKLPLPLDQQLRGILYNYCGSSLSLLYLFFFFFLILSMSEDEIWGYSSSTSYTITVYPNKWFDHYFYPSSSPVPTPKPSQTIAPNSSFLQLQNPPNTLLSHPLCCCCCYLVSCKKRSLFNLHSKTVAYKMCVCVYLSLHILHYLITLPISLDELEQEKHPVRPSIHKHSSFDSTTFL